MVCASTGVSELTWGGERRPPRIGWIIHGKFVPWGQDTQEGQFYLDTWCLGVKYLGGGADFVYTSTTPYWLIN